MIKRCRYCGRKEVRKIKEDGKMTDDEFCSHKCKIAYIKIGQPNGWKDKMKMNICQICGKEYSRSETIRKVGDVWWSSLYDSTQCFTKATICKDLIERGHGDNVVQRLMDVCGMNKEDAEILYEQKKNIYNG